MGRSTRNGRQESRSVNQARVSGSADSVSAVGQNSEMWGNQAGGD